MRYFLTTARTPRSQGKNSHTSQLPRHRVFRRSLRFERLEARRLLSGAAYPELPGMVLVDPRPDQFEGQVVYLAFDGARNVTYNGPVVVEGIDVQPYRLADGPGGDRDQAIAEIVGYAEAVFQGRLAFTTQQPREGIPYSTIYIGADHSGFDTHGRFRGIAEAIDIRNENAADSAFVFAGGLDGSSLDSSSPTVIAQTLVHETAHLLGYRHTTDLIIGDSIHDYAEYEKPISDTTEERWKIEFPGKSFLLQEDNSPRKPAVDLSTGHITLRNEIISYYDDEATYRIYLPKHSFDIDHLRIELVGHDDDAPDEYEHIPQVRVNGNVVETQVDNYSGLTIANVVLPRSWIVDVNELAETELKKRVPDYTDINNFATQSVGYLDIVIRAQSGDFLLEQINISITSSNTPGIAFDVYNALATMYFALTSEQGKMQDWFIQEGIENADDASRAVDTWQNSVHHIFDETLEYQGAALYLSHGYVPQRPLLDEMHESLDEMDGEFKELTHNMATTLVDVSTNLRTVGNYEDPAHVPDRDQMVRNLQNARDAINSALEVWERSFADDGFMARGETSDGGSNDPDFIDFVAKARSEIMAFSDKLNTTITAVWNTTFKYPDSFWDDLYDFCVLLDEQVHQYVETLSFDSIDDNTVPLKVQRPAFVDFNVSGATYINDTISISGVLLDSDGGEQDPPDLETEKMCYVYLDTDGDDVFTYGVDKRVGWQSLEDKEFTFSVAALEQDGFRVGSNTLHVFVAGKFFPSDNPYQFYGSSVTTFANIQLAAESNPDLEYSISVSAGANGTVAPSNLTSVDRGSTLSLIATPNTKYVVDAWYYNDSDEPAQYGGATFTTPSVYHDGWVEVTFRAVPPDPGPIVGSLAAWGWLSEDVPGGEDFTAVSSGLYHSIALKEDGSIVAWGRDKYGSVSDVPPGDDFVAIDAGYAHNVALRSEGSLVAWGRNVHGESDVLGGTDYLAAAAGTNHTLILRSNGSVTGVGSNSRGQLDCPTGTNFVEIDAGHEHSLALRSDGTVEAWGWNGYGQSNNPPGGDYIAISAGASHSLALRANGTLVAWGDNSRGQLNVPSGSDYVAIAAGYFHNVALRSDGTLIAWGDNADGQLDTPTDNSYLAVSAGAEHSVAISSKPSPPELTIDDVRQAEGDGGGTTQFVFTVSLSNLTREKVSVAYTTKDGSAVSGSDFTARTGTLTIPANQASGTISISVDADDNFEWEKNFTVVLSTPINATIRDGTGVGTIVNDDQGAPPLVVSTLLDVVDGNYGEGQLSLREALQLATDQGNYPGGAQVTFAESLFADSSPESPTRIVLTAGMLFVQADTSLIGPGRELLVIDAENRGPVMRLLGNAELSGFTVTGGTGYSGGGVETRILTDVTMSDMGITGNTAMIGGGIFNNAFLTIRNSVISGNHATQTDGEWIGGGGIHNQGSLEIVNSVIVGNTAPLGGGIAGWESIFLHVAPTKLTNCTVAGNTASDLAAGIYLGTNTQLTSNNTIVAMNMGYGQLGGPGSKNSTASLIGGDPAFRRNPSDGGDGWGDDPSTGNSDESTNDDYGDLRLLSTSPIIDLGSNELALDVDGLPLAIDLAGELRIVGAAVDIGAYESPTSMELVVSTFGDVHDGDYGPGKLSLREAVWLASQPSYPGADTITFAESLHGWPIRLNLTPLTLTSDISIIGPGAGLLEINAAGGSGVISIAKDTIVTLSGITIAGGYSTNGGGGIHNFGGHVSVIDSIVKQNRSNQGGAGIHNEGGTVSVIDSTIRENYVHNEGGSAIDSIAGTVTIRNSLISDNTTTYGSAIRTADARISVINTVVSQNFCHYSTSCAGDAMFATNSTVTLTNTTVTNNGAGFGDIIVLDSSNVSLFNNIIVDNNSGYTILVLENSAHITAQYNLVDNWVAGVGESTPIEDGVDGNIFSWVDPFVDSSNGNYRLEADSVAIDSGNNDLVIDAQGNPLTTDLDGNPRIVGIRVDRGALEYPEVRPTLFVEITPSTFAENDGAGAAQGRVIRQGLMSSSVTVTLASNNTGKARVRPSSVMIPAGATTATFLLDAIDDKRADGLATATITANAPNFRSGATEVRITDDEDFPPIAFIHGLPTFSRPGPITFTVGGYDNDEGQRSIEAWALRFAGEWQWILSLGSFTAEVPDVFGRVDVEFYVIDDEDTWSLPARDALYVVPDSLVVTTAVDELDDDYEGNDFSLREALFLASQSPDVNTITFAEGVTNILLSQGALLFDSDVILIGPDITLDAGGNSRVAKVGEGCSVALNGLTLTGGSAAWGGGLWVEADAEVSLQDVRIRGNRATNDGGGIYASVGAAVTLWDTRVRGNTVDNATGVAVPGSGISIAGGTLWLHSGVEIEDNSSPAAGAALVVSGDATAFVDGVTFEDNAGFDLLAIETGTIVDLTHPVVTTSADENDGDYSPGDLSLREALMLANRSDDLNHISFADGIARIDLSLGQLAIASNVIVEGPGVTVNAGGSSRVLEIAGGRDVALVGLTLTGGNSDNGGGLSIGENARLTMQGAAIRGNTATAQGGGIYARAGASVEIYHSRIEENAATSSGGGIAVSDGLVRLGSGTEITNNSANAGGGVAATGSSTLYLDGAAMSGNQPLAMSLSAASHVVDLVAPVVTSAEDELDGDYRLGQFSLREALYLANRRPDQTVITFDPMMTHITLQHGPLHIQENLILIGQGVTLDAGGHTRVMEVVTGRTVELQGLALKGGTANSGGGLFVAPSARAYLRDVVTTGNQAELQGGGIYVSHGATLDVRNGVIADNHIAAWSNASSPSGGGVYNGGGTVTVANSTIAGNSATIGGGINNAGGTFTLFNSIVSLNSAASSRDVAGMMSPSSGSNLFGANPNFVRNPSTGDQGDLRLVFPSPAVDAGDRSLALDRHGNPLTTDLDGNERILGASVDMGPYEFAGSIPPSEWQNPTVRWDVNNDGYVSPLDVLIVINYINSHPDDWMLRSPRPAEAHYYDVNGDWGVTPRDVLELINRINAMLSHAGEGEAPSVEASVAITDFLPEQAWMSHSQTFTDMKLEDAIDGLIDIADPVLPEGVRSNSLVAGGSSHVRSFVKKSQGTSTFDLAVLEDILDAIVPEVSVMMPIV